MEEDDSLHALHGWSSFTLSKCIGYIPYHSNERMMSEMSLGHQISHRLGCPDCCN